MEVTLLLNMIIPLSPKSDQCQISPCNNEFVVIRIQGMITQEEFPLYFILCAPLVL